MGAVSSWGEAFMTSMSGALQAQQMKQQAKREADELRSHHPA